MFLIISMVILTIIAFVGTGYIPTTKKIKFDQDGYYNTKHNKFVSTEKASNQQRNQWEKVDANVEYLRKSEGYNSNKFQFLSLIFILFIGFGMFKQVDATEVVVVTQFGEVKEVIYSPGLKTKSPLDVYHVYSLKIQEIRYDNIEDAGVSFYSKDSQPVDAMLTVQWRIKADEAQVIYENFGGDIDNVRSKLGSLVMERTKSSLSTFTAENLISNRSSLSISIEQLVVSEIESRDMPVEIIAIYLTDFAFSDAFEAAVEAKMIADQQRLKAETEKQIAIIQAEQQLATTILQAEAALEEAKGEANALLAIAQAEAAALSAKLVDVSRTLGFPVTEVFNEQTGITTYSIDTTGKTAEEIQVIFNYVQYIAYLQTWDGVLPTVITDGSGIIINP